MENRFKGRNILVIGAGRSGIGATSLLCRLGAKVILYDGNKKADREKILGNFPPGAPVSLCIGELSEEAMKCDLSVISPGVPLESEVPVRLKELGIPIIGEIELAFEAGSGDVLAITGTNGKTTTTALLGEIMKAYALDKGNKEVYVVGNIGNPYTSAAENTTSDSIIVAEISSFQLETIEKFHPKISAVLNITPDHLDRHHTMEEYASVKFRISENQTSADTVVLNYDDPYTREFGERARAGVVYFTRKPGFNTETEGLKKADFLRLAGDDIYYNDEKIVNTKELHLLGAHNYENVMAAVGMAVKYGVPFEKIREVVRSFKAVEHRIEFVKNVEGVDYYNDSKGTNPDAAIKAVHAMNRKTVLIAGGYDKKLSFDEWIESFGDIVKSLVLIGETAEAIAKCAREHGFNEIHMAGDLKEAVDIAHAEAKSGEAVLLSPACASWGMFTNFEERGRRFKEYVCSL